ncbi:hypothetical protein BSFP_014780 [Burkholderia stabilis]|uniref:Uncharacterized protein n=1 Tax=Burkholderia stabilis TaxID=95485 RepID=A0A1Y1BFE0_9BURK|nr:hypothetical protein BSFP_014780 [Burkholderia stabilis]
MNEAFDPGRSAGRRVRRRAQRDISPRLRIVTIALPR